jgi:IS30 family transposase
VKSLTNDNVVESATHVATAAYLRTNVWFCRPYQTNQSARIEQINKLVRLYIPK